MKARPGRCWSGIDPTCCVEVVDGRVVRELLGWNETVFQPLEKGKMPETLLAGGLLLYEDEALSALLILLFPTFLHS